ncbi:MAG TPA: thioredoxin [Myxococcaceae bacterium]|nr:thioredoxin [Myxococcaceae bacterium]
MASENVLNVNDADFEAQVLGSDQPVLVDFWATWCAPCKAIAPSLDALADAYKGKVRVAKVNVEENQGVPQQFGIRSLPTLLMFKDGKVIDQLVGAVPRSKLEEAIKKAL